MFAQRVPQPKVTQHSYRGIRNLVILFDISLATKFYLYFSVLHLDENGIQTCWIELRTWWRGGEVDLEEFRFEREPIEFVMF